MKYPSKYSFLAFFLNSIVDNGGFIELEVIKSEINKKTVFKYLKEKFGDEIDISLYTEEEILELENYFHGLYSTVDESKFLVQKNGICLLIGYCLNALQNNPEN